jgi:hypothetical protein
MRGKAAAQRTLLMVGSVEERIPQRHPIRRIKTLADEALASMSGLFDAMYAKIGRPSMPPERLLKAQLLTRDPSSGSTPRREAAGRFTADVARRPGALQRSRSIG